MIKVGVIGKGFVGNAVVESYDQQENNVKFYDPFKTGSVNSLQDLTDSDVLYICVPTPSNGITCDDSIVDKTLSELVTLSYTGPIVCKSTIPAGVYRKYSDKLMLMFIPEFLRAATAVEDYKNTEYLVIGISDIDKRENYYDTLERIFSPSKLKINDLYFCTLEEACMVKYFENSFLAVKVSLMNEFHRLIKVANLDWDRVISALTADSRINPDHTQVPGPDGKYGWGGHCFPKDTEALIHTAHSLYGLELPVLEAAVKSNEFFRNEY